MTYYIKIDENSQAVGQPFVDTNLKRIIPSHDWNSMTPPSGWIECEMTEPPELGVYQTWDETVSQHFKFEIRNGQMKRVWKVRNMTPEERKTKQDAAKKEWDDLDTTGYDSWSFDEIECRYRPPMEPPRDGKDYEWDAANQNWKEATE